MTAAADRSGRRRIATAAGVLLAVVIAGAIAVAVDAQGWGPAPAPGAPPHANRAIAASLGRVLDQPVSRSFRLGHARAALEIALGQRADEALAARVRLAKPPTSREAAPPPPAAAPLQALDDRPVFTPGRPARVYVAGDSLAGEPGADLFARIAGIPSLTPAGAVDSRPSTGLVQPSFFNWFDYLPGQLRERRPDLVVGTWGANDGLGFGDTPGAAVFGSAPWQAEYRRRVATIMDMILSSGARLVWLGVPIAGSAELSAKYRLINSIIRSEAERRSGRVAFVDLYDKLSDGNGGYTDTLPDASGQPQRVRSADGIHYYPAGAQIAAAAALDAIPQVIALRRR